MPKLAFKDAVKPVKRNTKRILDEELMYNLAARMISINDIAILMKCSQDTISKHYKDVIEAGRSNARRSLLEAMWENAIKNNNFNAQRWLSEQKHILGFSSSSSPSNQIDSTPIEVTINPLPFDEPKTIQHNIPEADDH